MSTHPHPPAPTNFSLSAALAQHGRVIGALILRELHTRYGRENVGYLWMVGEPLLLASVIGLVHSQNSHSGISSDMNPVAFAVLGYTLFIVFRGIVNRAEGTLEANSSLLYHRQVTILDLCISRALLEFGGVFLTFAILMTLLVGMGLAEPPERPLVVIAAWILMLWYSIGHSLVIMGISHDNRTVGRLIHPYSYFMTFLSGAFFAIGWMPHLVRTILTYIPITSIFELVRYGWFRSAKLDYFFGLYLFASCLILTWLGLICIAITRKRIHLS